MNKLIQYTCILIGIAFVGTACEKVIDVDLNDAEPKMVVEANVSHGVGNNLVILSYTTSYFTPEAPDMVSNASVIIRDDAGNSWTLNEIQPGVYNDATLDGTPGTTYSIEIQAEGQVIEASSTMPGFVAIDSLVAVPGPDGFSDDTVYAVRCFYADEGGVANYYRAIAYKNGETEPAFYADNDDSYDGQYSVFPFFQFEWVPGDTIAIELQGVDKDVYDYMSGLAGDVGQGGATAAPGNPETNLSGDVLGYFSAHTFEVDTVILP